jgi:hypothetical protein
MSGQRAHAERQSASPGRGAAGARGGAAAERMAPDIGNLATQRLLRAGATHAKLAVGRPDDPHEQEADRIGRRKLLPREELPRDRRPSGRERRELRRAHVRRAVPAGGAARLRAGPTRSGADPIAAASPDGMGNQATQRRLRGDAARPRPMAFPEADRILRGLGVDTTLNGVHDPAACTTRGTPAFTAGTVTHFASDHPGLHVAAHEAAHQLQHRGLTHDAGLGAEGHAGAVADAVVAGLPAAALITRRGEPIPSAIRNYVLTNRAGVWKNVEAGAVFARLSETGDAFVLHEHEAYATPDLISNASHILEAKRSGVHISAGAGSFSVEAPDGSGTKALSRVDPKFDVDVKGEGKFTADCRQAARQIMGPQGGSDDTPRQEEMLCQPGGDPARLSGKPEDLVWFAIFLDQRIADTPDYATMTPEQKEAIQKKAREDYDGMSDEEKAKFKKNAKISPARAQQLGIDQGAAPAVGEAYAVFPATKAGDQDFRFHYAAVIMITGVDSVTLENADESTDRFAQRDQLTTNWHFSMYGPASKEQTFYDEDQQKTHDPTRHVIAVGTQPKAPPDVGDYVHLSTAALMARRLASKDANEQYYMDVELGTRTILADVQVIKKNKWLIDDHVSVGVGSAKTDSEKTPEGGYATFRITAGSVLPAGAPLTVKLYEGLLFDSTMGTESWDAPFARTTWAITKGSASYTLTLRM